VVTKDQAPYKERVLYVLGGLAPEINLRINNADINTLKTALLTRMYYCKVGDDYVAPPVPDRMLLFTRLHDFKHKLQAFHTTPVSLEQVVEMYTGRKKALYQNALESLSITPVSKSDAVSVAFVKCEKVKPSGAPRCIQPRDSRYNLSLGAYIKPIEHRLYKRIKKIYGDGPTVIKGYNVQQVGRIMVGKWESFEEPVAIGLDATKFDMHVSEPMLAWEHSIYNSIYQCKELETLLKWQMFNVGRGYCDDGKLRYKVKGRRFSGDMNTALGNCIIMCALIYAYSRERGVPTKLMNNGDDCVVFMERRHLAAFSAGLDKWFLEMGFRMTVEEPCYELAQIEFCQMHCIRTSNGPVMVRNIPSSVSKDCMSIVPLDTETAMRKWLGAVGECGEALTKGVPISQEFYRFFSRCGTKGSNIANSVQFRTGIHMLMHDLKMDNSLVDPQSRYDVWRAWGILPDEQEIIERWYQQASIEYGTEVHEDHTTYPHFEWG